jgi:Beta-ketoacyl synthase, N-terminal domain
LNTLRSGDAVAVVGVGLWGIEPPVVELPRTDRSSRPRRRASLLARMVADVATRAAQQAGVSLARVPVVMGSAFGEMATTMELLGEREGDGLLSPTRFHNSVHNNAAGQLSIANQNHSFSTSLAAGDETVAMVVLEALGLLATRGGEVLLIVADEPLPATLLRGQVTAEVAAALVLAAHPDPLRSGPPLAWLGELRQIVDPTPGTLRPIQVANPCLSILPLVEVINAGGGPTRIDLSAGRPARWSIGVVPAGAQGAGPP